MLRAVVLAVLSGAFGSHGILTLASAYRTHKLADWSRLAIMGGLSVLLSAVMAYAIVAVAFLGTDK